jgi:Tripartite tricarboxylate transporter family receptor
VIRAAPDGYTLLIVSTATAINASLYQKLNFDVLRDLEPIAGFIRGSSVLEINPLVPARTLPDFIAYAPCPATGYARPMKPSARSLERLRALRLLARCQHGCTEAVMMTYGFTIDFLAGLVSDGLITAEPSTMRKGGRQVVVVWLQITAAGRKAVER